LRKRPSLDLGFEIGVGRRDDPHVHLAIGRRPDAADLALLEHPQEPDLHRGAHLADLVEEDRAPVGLLEQTLTLAGRAGERAAGMTEQLRLEE